MKKAVYTLLIFIGIQAVTGVAAPLLFRLISPHAQQVAMAGPAIEKPEVLAWALLFSNVFAPLVLLAWRLLPSPRLPHVPRNIPWAVLLFFAALLLTTLLSEALPLEDRLESTFSAILSQPVALLSLTVVGPLCEELVFRRALIGHLLNSGRSPLQAMFLSALLFGVIHLNPAQMLPAFLLGLVFGLIYVRTGQLWVCVLLHMLNNTLSVLQTNYDPDFQWLQLFPSTLTLLAAVAAALLIGAFCLRKLLSQPTFNTDSTTQS